MWALKPLAERRLSRRSNAGSAHVGQARLRAGAKSGILAFFVPDYASASFAPVVLNRRLCPAAAQDPGAFKAGRRIPALICAR